MFDVNKVKDHLLKICNETKELDPKSFKNFRRMWFRRDISVFLDDTDIKEFNKAMDKIREDEFIRYNFTEKFIESKLEEIISEAFKLPQNKREQFIKNELQQLKSYLKKEINEWFFIVPIENLSVKRKFSVGDVVFYKINRYRKRKLKNLMEKIIKDNKNYTKKQKKEFLKTQEKYIINPLEGVTCAEVKVRGVIDSAQQTVLHKIRLALSILKLYSYYNDDSYKRYFGIVGEVIRHTDRVIIRYPEDQKNINPLFEKVGYLFEYELDKNRIKFMKKNGFDKLNKILKKQNPTEFESRLLTSIYWFGKAMNIQVTHDKQAIYEKKKKKHENLEYFSIGERFLKLFISLECLLIFDENEPITNNISERCALLLVKKYEDRKKIKNKIKDLYKLRSKIVHHGEVFIPKNDLVYLTDIVQAVIITLIKLKDKFNFRTKEDLREYFERVKLS